MFDVNIKRIYNKSIELEWDEVKRQRNIVWRALDFADAGEIFNGKQVTKIDVRKYYGELRYIALGMLKARLVVVVYTERYPNILRIISFRKANKRELKYYESKISKSPR